MILVVVYVGAVAVLFLFVVMLLDVDFAELKQGFVQYLPIGGADRAVRRRRTRLRRVRLDALARRRRRPRRRSAACRQHRGARPRALHPIFLLLPGGGADPAHRDDRRDRADAAPQGRASSGRTSPRRSRARRRRRSSCARSPRAPAFEGFVHGHRPHPLSDAGGDPVHDRRRRHHPQPQEHHRHPDVGRADPARGQHQPRRLLDPVAAT